MVVVAVDWGLATSSFLVVNVLCFVFWGECAQARIEDDEHDLQQKIGNR